MKKFNLDPKKFESLLTLLIIILIVIETFAFLKGLFNLNFKVVEIILSFLLSLKEFLYRLTLLLFGLFILAKFSDH